VALSSNRNDQADPTLGIQLQNLGIPALFPCWGNGTVYIPRLHSSLPV